MHQKGTAKTKKVAMKVRITRASGRVDEFNPNNILAVWWVNLKQRLLTK